MSVWLYSRLSRWSKTAARFHPIYLPELQKQLTMIGWIYKTSLDISAQFIAWHTQLMQQFELKRHSLTKRFGADLFMKMYVGYQQLLTMLLVQKISGIVVCATRNG